ncbi:BlaI/MecI/CopY family transcriptional regulator [Anaerostipes faecalis]|uniref:BlaI/MecI/CopY family transcriptional regulator n=1 Tax=Anaerostipes faecalis TaxID=2738446 RepID=UPI003F126676
MKNNFYLTKYEKSILKILWKEDRPLTYAEIKDALDGQFDQIHRVLNSLMDKELIYVSGFVPGKRNARQFSPVLKEDEFTADMLIDDLEDEKMLEKVAVALFARVAGVDQSDKSEKENQQFISELESLLEKYKKENK